MSRTIQNTVHRGAFLAAAAYLITGFVGTQAQTTGVVWTNVVNATAAGSTLQKSAGCDGCEDAGGHSQQSLSADGFVEFTVGETGTFWVAGLNQADGSTLLADIDFAIRFNGSGYADVLESGAYQPGGDTTYVPGDVFRIVIVGGRVQFSKNGQFLRESAATPTFPLVLDATLGSMGASIRNATLVVSPPPPAGGGLMEKSGSPALRPRFTAAQIQQFLPAGGATGAFTFPAPYNTTGVRLTNSSICAGGLDCLWYVGYSYWRNISNHAGQADMYLFLGTDPNRGGQGPILLRYNKAADTVEHLGPLFATDTTHYWSTGEGWYFSGTQPTTLYTLVVGDSKLRRFDILARQFEPVPAMDLAKCPRPRICPVSSAYLIQAHSSDDDLVHSATVQDLDWRRLGCVVSRAGKYSYYAPQAGSTLDECHVDKSGRWLMIQETRATGAEINRIVDLHNGKITVVEDAEGALGHLDMGYGYAVGADNFNGLPNATVVVTFPLKSTQRPIGPVVHYNKRWDIVAANHVAHGNGGAHAATAAPYACGSHASRVPDMADEIVCFPLDATRNADGSLDVLVVGQVMTDLNATGGQDHDNDDYEQLPKGNLDVSGRYFIWTTNLGGDRLDAFLVKIPGERLMSETVLRKLGRVQRNLLIPNP
ncbi:MAG TPA: hypothetical protein VFO48_07095 [Vicinamibacterales bacterium]|nr:hypothetical protein [Vicinamibacterales bacterium]